MRRIMSKCSILFISVILTIIFSSPSNVHANQTSKRESTAAYTEVRTINFDTKKDGYYDYVLDSYDINIVVHENNTLQITETIGAYFNVEKHGIYRKLPLKNKVVRLDGTSSNVRAKISNIKASDKFTVSTEGGYKVLKIGDADYTLTGSKYYAISYLYDLGKDTGKDYDELYYDLIGLEWDTSISNITFQITMPKEFDPSLLGFSSGRKGSTDSSNVSFHVNGNVITGQYNGSLYPSEALTVRLELPEGYFVVTENSDGLQKFSPIILSLVFALITLVIWYRYGKDDQVIETVEFYPPSGFNSAEVGFLYKGKAEKNDVISLLIYLANQGYIKITEIEETSLFTKTKSFKVTKLKEYEGNNLNERLFLNGLFSTKSPRIRKNFFNIISNPQGEEQEEYSNLEEVTATDLRNSFYVTLNAIIRNLNKKENIHKIFEKSSSGKGRILICMIIAIFILITVKPVREHGGAEQLPFALLFPGIGFSVLFSMLFGKTPVFTKVFGLIWGLGFGGIPWLTMVLPALLVDPLYLTTYVIGILCILVIVICLKAMPKRTPYGNVMLGKIRGLKKFLETTEKQKLEALVMQDPSYFYNILPYTYVLGVSDKWIKKFESIALQAPSWYEGGDSFNTYAFGHFMNSTMSSASSAMSSSPSSSGSGGDSGGGSSGGGSGGGGGGSW